MSGWHRQCPRMLTTTSSTETSWRRIRISRSLAAALRASSPSQPNTAQEIRYSSRNSPDRDHFVITGSRRNPGQHTCNEFWHATGQHASPELIRGIMRDLGLVPCQPRPWRHNLTQPDPGAGPSPDLVHRDFTAGAPGQKMVGDITYYAQLVVMCSSVA